MINSLKNNFKLIYKTESFGLARFKDENPHICRLILKKLNDFTYLFKDLITQRFRGILKLFLAVIIGFLGYSGFKSKPQTLDVFFCKKSFSVYNFFNI